MPGRPGGFSLSERRRGWHSPGPMAASRRCPEREGAGTRPHAAPAALALLLAAALAAPTAAAPASVESAQDGLVAVFGAAISRDPLSGVARWVALPHPPAPVRPGGDAATVAGDFLAAHGGAFGLADPGRELRLRGATRDALGMTHLEYRQVHEGIEVFGGVLRVHLDAAGRPRGAGGRVLPNPTVPATPRVDAATAAASAIHEVIARPPRDDADGTDDATATTAAIAAAEPRLVVYDDGLPRGFRGDDHLAWLVRVDGAAIRETVVVDALDGGIVGRWSALPHALFRRLWDTSLAAPVWVEGDAFPGPLAPDQAEVLAATADAYWFFRNGFGRDSYNGTGGEMRAALRPPNINCPNATWNGIRTSFCDGTASDDIVAHEWAHAYTEHTDDLLYQWQTGALNEAFSDLWGETIDEINGRGTDLPSTPRTVGRCSEFMSRTAAAELVVASPPAIAGRYPAGAATFGPNLTPTGWSGALALAVDGVGAANDACQPLANAPAVAGRIALVDRGGCDYPVKVAHAQAAGAIGVVVANDDPAGAAGTRMGGSDATIRIPSILVPWSTGVALKAALASPPSVTIHRIAGDISLRWLLGEDAAAFGTAVRDMWTPECAGDPPSTDDPLYYCGSGDGGGVHVNSAVPNHGFALLVDGGVFRGRTIPAIGLVKAAHLYWRAQSVYQVPASDFADHADALEASCADLAGIPLPDLSTLAGIAGPSGEAITASDCESVSRMIEAVGLRTGSVERCGFDTLLSTPAPALCASAGVPPRIVWLEDFEHSADGWVATAEGRYAGWPGLAWEVRDRLPRGRSGRAAFAADPNVGTCNGGREDASGRVLLETPELTLPPDPTSFPGITFDHLVATEPRRDGGNLEASINGGPWRLVPATAFDFNPYNAVLEPAPPNPDATNPLAGQPAFTGTDPGSFSGTWAQSHLDLAAIGARAGDRLRLRFAMGIDGCNGFLGWYVDNVALYACDVASRRSLAVEQVKASAGRRATLVARARIPTSGTPRDAIEPGVDFAIGVAGPDGPIASAPIAGHDCRANGSGTRLNCRSADGSVKAAFARQASLPGEWEVKLTLRGLAIATPPGGPLELSVARPGTAWSGAAANCRSGRSATDCRN